MSLPDIVAESVKSAVTPAITAWIDAITNGEGTHDLVEYVLLLIDTIKERKDFAEDLAAFFGEADAKTFTRDLFALVAQEVKNPSQPQSHATAEQSDAMPKLEAPPVRLRSPPRSAFASAIPSTPSVVQSAFPTVQPAFLTDASSSPALGVAKPVDLQPRTQMATMLNKSGSRIVSLSGSKSPQPNGLDQPLSASSKSRTSVSPQQSSGHGNGRVSVTPARAVSGLTGQVPSMATRTPPSSGVAPPSATKQISLKRSRELSSQPEPESEQPVRKSITLKKRDPSSSLNDELDSYQRQHESFTSIARPPINNDQSSMEDAQNDESYTVADDQYYDENVGDEEFVPVETNVNAPFQPQFPTQPRNAEHDQQLVQKLQPHSRQFAQAASTLSALATSAATTRCLFWPSCTRGAACPFVHPSQPCSFFPKCRFGDKCLNIHPSCKFGKECFNENCGYFHPAGRTATTAAGAAPAPVAATTVTPCHFGDSCTRADCFYSHPRDYVGAQFRPAKRGGGGGVCPYDPRCNSISCTLSHPQREAADRAWLSESS